MSLSLHIHLHWSSVVGLDNLRYEQQNSLYYSILRRPLLLFNPPPDHFARANLSLTRAPNWQVLRGSETLWSLRREDRPRDLFIHVLAICFALCLGPFSCLGVVITHSLGKKSICSHCAAGRQKKKKTLLWPLVKINTLYIHCVWEKACVCVLVCLFSGLDVWFVAPGWLWKKEDYNLLYSEMTQVLASMKMEEFEFSPSQKKTTNQQLESFKG